MNAKPSCFVCDVPLGGTYMNATTYPGSDTPVPALCLRCGGRVHGLIFMNREPLVRLLKDAEWSAGDDLNDVQCPECGAFRDSDGHNHENPAPHEHHCRLALAIGAPRTAGEGATP